MKTPLLFRIVLASLLSLNASLVFSAEKTNAECAQLLQSSVYPSLIAENNEDVVKEMKETEKSSGSCTALNVFYCLTGNKECKNK